MTVVAITGGGRGIGLAIAQRLASDGMRVAIGDIDADSATAAAATIDGAIGFSLDVSDATSFTRFIDQVETALGPIKVLVNNAGIMPIGPFLDQDAATAERAFGVNAHGPLNGMRAVLPRMIATGGGHIVNVASTAGASGIPGGVVYSATKFAVIGMSEAVRREFAGSGISVTAVLPAFTNTELIAGTSGLRGVPTIEPRDVANAVAQAIRRKQATVFVPGYLATMTALTGLLPTGLTDRLLRLMGGDRVFLDFDRSGRSNYDKRISG